MAEIITMPKLGFDMAEGTLVRWVISEGEHIEKGAILAEIETDKATVEVESVYNGTLAQHLVPVGEIVPINTPIAVIAEPGEEFDLEQLLAKSEIAVPNTITTQTTPVIEQPDDSKSVSEGDALPQEKAKLPGGVKASPIARRIAGEMGINLATVKGSGPAGRITKKDLEAYITAPVKGTALPSEAGRPWLPLSPNVDSGTQTLFETTSAPLSKLRTIIGRRMTEVKQQVPHFYLTHNYDAKSLLDLRRQINTYVPETEKISINDFVVKATAIALRSFPNLNASYEGDHVVRHGQVNIGVAVAVDDGLMTVVCHDSDSKSVRQISAELREKVRRVRIGKVRPDDIEGSTFTVSNLGMYDIENFIAIINPPEAAILAIGSASEVPVVENGKIVPGLRMKATISVDHRVSDGAEAARFLQTLSQYLEQPVGLIL